MRLAILCVMLMLPGLAGASMYKCVDKSGNTTYSSTPCPDNPQLMKPSEGGSSPGTGVLTVNMDSRNSFMASGTVNGLPVQFVIDTGAAYTTLSLRVAQAAGIKECVGDTLAATAGGIVRGCVVVARELTLGQFHFSTLRISVLPDMQVDGLLGMDVLSRLKVHQEKGVMHISSP